jgi:hypothetical protein
MTTTAPQPRLRAVGEALREKATAALRADRVANTPRRANMADGAIARAQKELDVAEACVRIAQAATPPLSRIRCLAQVRTLESLLARGRVAAARKLDRRYEEIIDEEGAPCAAIPKLWLYNHILRDAGREATKAGAHEAGAVLQSTADRSPEVVDLDAHANRAAKRMLTEAKGAKWVPWQWKDAAAERKHLEQLEITTDADLRQMLIAYVAAKSNRAPVDPQVLRLRQLERGLVGAKIPGYFPTPRHAAERVVELARIAPGMLVLEPSAGKGDLAEAARELGRTCHVLCVERHDTLRRILMEKGFVTHHGDFLEVTLASFDGWCDIREVHGDEPFPGFARAVMNPPFEDGADVTHVQHAFGLLRPGGRMVAIMSEGTFFRSDRQAAAFRAWLDELGAENEKLPAGTFDGSDVTQRTNVATRIVAIDKPGTT